MKSRSYRVNGMTQTGDGEVRKVEELSGKYAKKDRGIEQSRQDRERRYGGNRGRV